MNTTHRPLTDTELEKLSCLESSHKSTAVLRLRADDGRTYLFATAHYVDGVHEANPTAQPEGPPERLRLRFTTGQIVILGLGLERIEDELAEGHLLGLKTVDPRYASVFKRKPIVMSITV